MGAPLDLKSTLNLPKTDFPMKANLPQNEPKMLARWEELRIYDRIRQARKGAPIWVLHDDPSRTRYSQLQVQWSAIAQGE